MKTTELIGQVITALYELEAKGCHSVCFEYGNGQFRIRIFRGKIEAETVVYGQTVNVIGEPSQLEEVINHIQKLKNHVTKTVFQCYKMEYVKGEKPGKWEKTGSSFEFGDNATSAMLIDGSGYHIDDPDNCLRYFIDMKNLSETEK
jgi:rRNA processing protein Krr1/Pno1